MDEEEASAICDILKFLQQHPQARHTEEGIAKYWIFQQRLQENLDLVLRAIEYLQKEGFLEKVELADGGHFYQVKHDKLDQIPQAIENLTAKKQK